VSESTDCPEIAGAPCSKIGDLLDIYQEYPANSVGKQGKEFLIAKLKKS
jgi:hypothetical protein